MGMGTLIMWCMLMYARQNVYVVCDTGKEMHLPISKVVPSTKRAGYAACPVEGR